MGGDSRSAAAHEPKTKFRSGSADARTNADHIDVALVYHSCMRLATASGLLLSASQ